MKNEKIIKKVNEVLEIFKDLTGAEKDAVLQISQILLELNSDD